MVNDSEPGKKRDPFITLLAGCATVVVAAGLIAGIAALAHRAFPPKSAKPVPEKSIPAEPANVTPKVAPKTEHPRVSPPLTSKDARDHVYRREGAITQADFHKGTYHADLDGDGATDRVPYRSDGLVGNGDGLAKVSRQPTAEMMDDPSAYGGAHVEGIRFEATNGPPNILVRYENKIKDEEGNKRSDGTVWFARYFPVPRESNMAQILPFDNVTYKDAGVATEEESKKADHTDFNWDCHYDQLIVYGRGDIKWRNELNGKDHERTFTIPVPRGHTLKQVKYLGNLNDQLGPAPTIIATYNHIGESIERKLVPE